MNSLARFLLALILGFSIVPFILAGLTFGFPHGRMKVRGVSLGGWLVLEVCISTCRKDAIDM